MAKRSTRANKPRRTQEARRAETRLSLIEATISSLIDRGYARTTTSEIARRASVTSGALQHHFNSKDELMLAVAQHHIDEMQAHLEVLVNPVGSETAMPTDWDWLTFIKMLRDIYAGSRYLAMWEIVLGTRGDPALHNRVLQHRIQSIGILEKLWKRAFGRKFGTERNSVDLMHFTLATFRGFVFYNVIAPDRAFLDRQLSLLVETLSNAMDHPNRKRVISPLRPSHLSGN